MLKTRLPWIQAPMYHYSGKRLALACTQAGMLGCLGVEDPQRMEESLKFMTEQTTLPFAVNLFVLPENLIKNQIPVHPLILKKLNQYRTELNIPFNPPQPTKDSYHQELDKQLALIKKYKVSTVIFTFGLPSQETVQNLHSTGTTLIGSATTVEEALQCQDVGMDAVILQGIEAGGHRTSINLPSYGDSGLISLLSTARPLLNIPIIAAGGITSGPTINAALKLADMVSMGSLFMTAAECSTPASHRAALFGSTHATKTVLSRVFTGRPARLIPNRFYKDMMEILGTIPGGERNVPWNLYARDIFGAAARSDNPEMYILWANQAVGSLGGRMTKPAAEIVAELEESLRMVRK